MEHSFDPEIATKYGIEEAILLNHIAFWTSKNKANEKHYHDGRYWTYNSSRAFATQFPYIPQRTLTRKLQNLVDKGLLLTANYNENKYDRTLWYALTDLAESIMPKCQMESAKMSNGDDQNGEPIPDNNQIKYQEIINYFNENCPSFPKCRTLSKKRKDAISARFKTYSFEDFKEICLNAENSEFLKGNNNMGWKADFDWFMCDSNFAKVLEGKYNKPSTIDSAKNKIQQPNNNNGPQLVNCP